MNTLRLLNSIAKQGVTQSEASIHFLEYARLLAKHPDDVFAALAEAERGDLKGSRIAQVLRSAVAAGSTTDTDWASSIAAYSTMASSFLESLSSLSVFDYLRSNRLMRRCPLDMKVVLVTASLSGSGVNEGSIKPITSGSLDLAAVQPKKSTAIIVLNDEVVKLGIPAAASLFSSELRLGVSRATDATFLYSLYSGTSPISSSGVTATAAVQDVRQLLNAVNPQANSSPVFVCSPSCARALMLFGRDTGAPCFPNVVLSGQGELLPGVPQLVSDQLPSDANSPTAPIAMLIDGSGVVGDSDTVVVDATRQATLTMQSSPDSPELATTISEPLYQTGKVAVRCERLFGFALARSTAVASLSNIQW